MFDVPPLVGRMRRRRQRRASGLGKGCPADVAGDGRRQNGGSWFGFDSTLALPGEGPPVFPLARGLGGRRRAAARRRARHGPTRRRRRRKSADSPPRRPTPLCLAVACARTPPPTPALCAFRPIPELPAEAAHSTGLAAASSPCLFGARAACLQGDPLISIAAAAERPEPPPRAPRCREGARRTASASPRAPRHRSSRAIRTATRDGDGKPGQSLLPPSRQAASSLGSPRLA